MNKTKKKIILNAIQLFNKHGMVNVLNIDIAKYTDISLSNFNYHFKTKADLVYDVFAYMKFILNDRISNCAVMTTDGHALCLSKIIFEFALEFRFFYLATNNIIKTYPDLKKEMQHQVQETIQIIKNVNYFAIGKGYMHPEPSELPGLYDQLAHQIWLNSHFWLEQSKVRGKGEVNIVDGLNDYYTLLHPYLTEKGKEAYSSYINTLKVKSVILT